LADGVDPLAERRKAAGIPIAGKAADDYIEAQRAGWSNEEHAYQWEQTLGDAYCARLRPKTVNTITVDDVVSVLEPIWLGKAETATRLRMRIEKVLNFAKVKGWRSGGNPAFRKGNLDHLLPQRTAEKGHNAALACRDVPKVMQALASLDGVDAEALRFTMLSASRSGEVFGARWEEFDFEVGLWTVPAERMKACKEHRVPLSPMAV
jgi:integrase